MDQAVMNNTKQLLSKFKTGRGDLQKADGLTKDRVEVWRKNLHGLTDELMKQAKMLEELDNGGAGKTTEGGSELKVDYFDHLVAQISKEIHELLLICKNIMSLPQQYQNKQKKENIESQWRIMMDQMKNEVTKVLRYAQDQNSDHIALIAKLLNLKDNLQKQVFMGVLWRKLVIWMDLNIQSDEFVHSKVVEAIHMINDLKEQLKYTPSRMFFQEVDLETAGPYTIGGNDSAPSGNESVQNLEALCEGFIEMENLIKKNFKLSTEKLLAFTESNPVQITLREELEMVYKDKNLLDEENKNLKLSLISNRENDSKNLLELHNSLEKLKTENQVLALEVEDKIRVNKNQEAFTIKLKHQLKTSDDERNRLKTWYIPRLKETRKYQKELAMELDKIRSDAELLPSMFRAEAVFRNQCRKERDEAVEKMSEFMKKLNQLEKERLDLRQELDRKERLSLQAIAARSNMKSHLDNATQHLKDTETKVKNMMTRIKDAEEEVTYYKKRHDEMFASVSALNKRIEELEQHKLHLLDKLKAHGDKGGLEYIVKTQKLDQIKGKELQDRVVVEDYRPELNRSKHLAAAGQGIINSGNGAGAAD